MQLFDSVFTRLPELGTNRLILRAMRMSDARDIYEYSCAPQIARHVLWEAHHNIHQTRAYIRYVLRQYRDGTPSSKHYTIECCVCHPACGLCKGMV